MKARALLVIPVVAVLLVASVVLDAAAGPRPARGGKMSGGGPRAARKAFAEKHPKMAAAKHERALQQFDSDGNGSLDKTERAAAKATFVKKWDADGDGQLSDAERAAARAAARGHLRQRLQQRRGEGGRMRPTP